MRIFSGGKPSPILEIERELWSALIDVAKGQHTLPRILEAQTNIKKILDSEDMADISGWFTGVFAIYLIPQWPDLHTGREDEVRREVLEAAQARDRNVERNENEDDMQVDGQRTPQDAGPSTSSLQCAANGGGFFLSQNERTLRNPCIQGVKTR
jgi:hypothetical protein